MGHAAESIWDAEPGESLRVGPGFVLADVDTDSAPGYRGDKQSAGDDLAAGAAEFDQLQEMFFANSRLGDERKILLVLQAMDTAGKGGILRHVIGAVDPQGVQITAFKKPTDEELAHDFLWRIRPHAPGAGMIGVFDRSHYEDVLIGRVRELAPAAEIERRYDAINAFERQLVDEGTTVIKVMLHLGADEQKKRLQDRLARPEKHWKFNPGDIDERLLWPKYREAYQVMFDRTSTQDAPWYVIPADKKWYARLAVQSLLMDALRGMNLSWPVADFDVEHEKKRLAAS
ncbi:PPK2 family polyphosphate kinase [Microterricola viridarii]|uniref:Polyphosphate:nucleotide phosphotransferase, PPK2 family n=1 Tax=Microterricola viridarii TaxID=412690 RepID=A0A1H1MYG6_9MICO|nr:PPK2 family polyphosphate kinase [Microterricola viridarii]SDR91796.1 polyphosphate:nucleotide phosphotransferase, PPK2 family [Microterricola viridarii]